MSNIAGKAYAMNLVTPLKGFMVPINKAIFWMLDTRWFAPKLRGLITLSLIHYARWVILRAEDFPRLHHSQPRETLRYGYMLFFSNFNGTWEQYVDSFSAAIPSGLNFLWWKNIAWPTAVPEQPFHRYVLFNQITTDYYYSAYPMAASNDVKSAQKVQSSLATFIDKTKDVTPQIFMQEYNRLLKSLQNDISTMDATPIVSLAAAAITARRRAETGELPEEATVAVSATHPLAKAKAVSEAKVLPEQERAHG